MISYNPKHWFRFLFNFHKGDTLRQLVVFVFLISAYSGLIAYLELEYWNLSKDSNISRLSLLHNLLGFVLSLLLVFRTNTAYDRWWEGRKLWGSLVNNSRNLALKLNALLKHENLDDRRFFRRMIPLFASVLRDHLALETTRLALDSADHPELASLDKNKHVPNQVVSLITQRIYTMQKDGTIDGYQLMTINSELQSFAEICGACERIKNTPIPFSYSTFVKKFIFIYVVTLPFGFVFSLGYWVIPVVAFIFYVLASLEVIAEEIEDPFGGDENDLPTQKIAANIKRNIEDIL
ncbi:MAG: bestrophin family protein [Chitinophagaceae bacterium]|nr:bestrophin family protein [Chitinophagaceae bacterium]